MHFNRNLSKTKFVIHRAHSEFIWLLRASDVSTNKQLIYFFQWVPRFLSPLAYLLFFLFSFWYYQRFFFVPFFSFFDFVWHIKRCVPAFVWRHPILDVWWLCRAMQRNLRILSPVAITSHKHTHIVVVVVVLSGARRLASIMCAIHINHYNNSLIMSSYCVTIIVHATFHCSQRDRTNNEFEGVRTHARCVCVCVPRTHRQSRSRSKHSLTLICVRVYRKCVVDCEWFGRLNWTQRVPSLAITSLSSASRVPICLVRSSLKSVAHPFTSCAFASA